MAEQNPGFGETNTPERAGGLVRDHVRAVIESAEGNAAEIRRRAREDAEALDQERADSASRLTTQIGELEGSFTSFGERLGKEVLPSGKIKGELGSASEESGDRPASATEGQAASGSATAWRAPAQAEPEVGDDADEAAEDAEEGEGLFGGLKKRFTAEDAEDEDEEEEAAAEPGASAAPSEQEPGEDDAPGNSPDAAPPAASQTPSDWVPEGSEGGESEAGEADEASEADEDAVSWAPAPEPDTAEPEADDETASGNPLGQESADAESEPAGTESPDPAAGASGDPQTPPRGRIARLLLGRRPGE